MRTIEHTVSHLIIHDLAKEPGSPARLMLRDAPCTLDAAALRLAERLCAQYESRSAKGFGRFEEDEESYPLARWLREHLIDETLDFTTLSRQLAERVQAIADEEELEDGGHLVLARIREGDGDSLWIALLGSAEGVAIGG
ncbi:MAG TPA: nucleoid-associated protein, partial [Thauera sp.]|nr:nucleoid-associated protein [Thauera sp.]